MFKDLIGGELTMWLEDRKDLWMVLEHHHVDLVLHGHRHHYLRRPRGFTQVISCSSTTKGCGLTGQRFAVHVKFNLRTGNVTCDRVQFAAPARVRTLAEVFDSEESMRAWVKLAERAYESEDTFVRFAKEFQSRDARLRALEALAKHLDVAALDLLRPSAEREASLALLILKTLDRERGLVLEDDLQ